MKYPTITLSFLVSLLITSCSTSSEMNDAVPSARESKKWTEYLSEKLTPIREYVAEIDERQEWSAIRKNDLFLSTEGGEATFYELNGTLRKIEVSSYGEMGQTHTKFYLRNDSLLYVYENTYEYNRPMYYDSVSMIELNDTEVFDFEKSTVLEAENFFEDGKLIRIIVNQDPREPFCESFRDDEEKRLLDQLEELRKVVDGRSDKTTFQEIITQEYELVKPSEAGDEVLVLFGGYPEKALDVRREFPILEKALESGISVLFVNFNGKLWLTEAEKLDLAGFIEHIFEENELSTNKVFIGGYSSGGNVTLLLSNFLVKNQSKLTPKGVFVVDSPIDLAALYRGSEKNIERNFSVPSVQESTWIIQSLGGQFGNPHEDLSEYEKASVYTFETDHFSNIENLKNTSIRFYTEPDTLWWKENRMADHDQMNAYYLERLAQSLKKANFRDVQYIPTENKGYRANGNRHPHSWSIVDRDELVEWIMK